MCKCGSQVLDEVAGTRKGDRALVHLPNDDSCVILEAENRLQSIQVFLNRHEAQKLGLMLLEGATVITWNSAEDRLTSRKDGGAA